MANNLPRIAIFMRYLTVSGAHGAMLKLAQGLVERGYPVDLVFSWKIDHHLELVPEGVRIVDLKSAGLLSSLFDFVKYLRQERPIATISTLCTADIINLLAKPLMGRKHRAIISVQNTVTQELKSDRVKSRWIIFLCARYLYFWADGLVAISQGVAKDLATFAKFPLGRIKIIYNPAVTADIFAKAKDPIDHPWFAPGQPPVVLGVGRLEKQKDFPTLLRAFAKVRQRREVRLVILGWGSEQPQLEALVHELGLAEDVTFPGSVRNPYAYMASSAVFVLSSIYEGLSNALIEALALGVPIVSTDCPHGPAEVLHNGEYGELVPVGDSDRLAEEILRVLDGKHRQAPESWFKQFTLDAIVPQYLELVENRQNNSSLT
ncbi:glycosyltransferase [Leptothermofonsia sp. ETS-13]|uniref:glycosyltransferase n=1 Tax=Leptothermofonsia sp. ETS-13 TaxID=3035696 RepID=UPI003B9FFD03